MMEIYSDRSIDYNSEGFARLYGWWNADEDEDEGEEAIRPKKDNKEDGTDNSPDDSLARDKIN